MLSRKLLAPQQRLYFMTDSMNFSSRPLAKRLKSSLQRKVGRLINATRTLTLKWRGQSDYTRWSDPEHLKESWDTRTAKLAGFIAPGSAVLEFGAARLTLPAYLPVDCTYTPSDLVDRGPGTLIYDLNEHPLPDFPVHDVAVFSGVLEYVRDVDVLVNHLSRRIPVIVASYAAAGDLDAKERLIRRSSGWVNDYTAEELQELFAKHGYACVETGRWESQHLFKFAQS